MSMQQVMRWGHDFPKDREGNYLKPLVQWGKTKCQRENPSISELPILSFPQSLNFARMWLS